MGMHTAQPMTFATARPGVEAGRVVLNLVGAAALVVSAFLHWTRDTAGASLTNRVFIHTDFAARTDIVKTAGGIVILIGLLAVIGLVDRTGWLTRLAGALGVIAFALFAIEVYRGAAPHTLQAGAWMILGGGVVLLVAGMLVPRPVAEVPGVIERDIAAERSRGRDLDARIADEERDA